MAGTAIVAETQVTSYNMLEESAGGLLDELIDHVRKDRGDGIEAFVCLANVIEAGVVHEDFLDNEDGDCFGKLGARLHDAEAEGDDFGLQEEIDDFDRVVFD